MRTITYIRLSFQVICGLTIAACPISAQTLINGSFELGLNPGVSINLTAVDSSTITGWTVTTGSIDYIGSRWKAADGNRCLDLSGTDAGSIAQTVSNFTIGGQYRLSFEMAGNPEGPPTTKNMEVSIGSLTQNFSFNGAGFTTTNLGWTLETINFTAASTTLDLTFTSLTAGDSGPALDAVSIVAVPEPNLGLAVLGGIFLIAGRKLKLL